MLSSLNFSIVVRAQVAYLFVSVTVCNVLLGLLLSCCCVTFHLHCYWFDQVGLHALRTVSVSCMTWT